MKLSKVFKTAIYIFIFLSLSSCGKKESPNRIGKFKVIDIKNDKFLSITSKSTLSCQNNYVMYDDIVYTKADSTTKIGDSISIMYVPKTECYFVKENFPKNYNAVENSNISIITGILSAIISTFILISIVYWVYKDLRKQTC